MIDFKYIRLRFLYLFISWTVIIAAFISYVSIDLFRNTLIFANIEAKAAFERNLLFRRWASMHGGVYVPVTEKTQPNEYLKNIPERDIQTPSGKRLTLMNPAYVLRQINDFDKDEYGVKGHITSLNPMRPENKPDEWEKKMLTILEQKHIIDTNAIDTFLGKKYFRYIRLLNTEKSCLKCHGDKYKIGQIRGGISISVPLTKYVEAQNTELIRFICGALILWFLGFIFLIILYRITKKEFKKKIEMQKIIEDDQKIKIENERRYRTMLENMELISVMLDIHGNISFCNNYLLKITGWKYEEIINQNWFDKFVPGQEDVKKIFSEAIRNGKIQLHYTNEILTHDGNLLLISWNNTTLYDTEDKVIGTTSIGEDITARTKAEITLIENEQRLKNQNEEYLALNEELKESNNYILKINEDLKAARQKAEENDKLKTAFLCNMSHEIRTPLNGILGFANLLKRNGLSDEKKTSFIKTINDCGSQLLSVINDVLEISKIETGQITLKTTETNINELLNELYKLFNPTVKENVILKLNINAKIIPIIDTDRGKLKQILINLLNNAIKFTKQGFVEFGYTIKNEIEPATLDFFVNDTGIGISEEMLNHIFERFSQEEDHFSRVFGGTGLGLPISKGLAKLMNGDIRVQSKKNVGTSFYLTIPLHLKNKETINKENNTMDQISFKDIPENITILYAEDNEVNFYFIQELLQEHKIHLLHAMDGKEAVDICSLNPTLDIILMDIKMPVMDGYDATRIINAMCPNIPVIALTAFALAEEKNVILKRGFTDYLSKPVDPCDLLNILRKYLKKK